LALLLFAVVGAGLQLEELTQIGMPGAGLLASLMWANVALAVFNLVPAFPMDGGRVLRALLAQWTSYVRATNIAASVGRALAFVFGFVGLTSLMFGGLGPVSNPFLVFIGLFIWMGASQEAGLVRMKSALAGIPVGRLMVTKFHALAPDDPLSSAAGHLLAGWQHDFPVLENGRVVGLLTRSALIDGLARQGPNTPVSASMLRHFPVIEPDETAESALLRLRREDGQTILAMRDGELVGLLTSENVSEYLMVQAAMHILPNTREQKAGIKSAGEKFSQGFRAGDISEGCQ
jgi:CBS domain-containing protein